ncbi:hypothetical protein GCM10010401_13220 [Rarobacter faecitabidus]|uniref:Ig-like domain-containing protein n=1 Tax=Rarobacter faecitabidus TaxID=13243 RepID=A0A542ZEB9_RARFA|nr:hypothetical protein [Rarobacter faecitabidus]TQL58629.1 hypothetical protein FB461_2047 [Rarobacter faecitabidus]
MKLTNGARPRTIALGLVLTLAAALTLAAPAGATPGTGQTKTISGVLRNIDGTPAAGAPITYDNHVCGTRASISGTADDSASVLTSATGTFSFPAYAGQCYSITSAEPLLAGGKALIATSYAAGTSGLAFTKLDSITANIKVTGVGAGATVVVVIRVEGPYGDTWYPLGSTTTDASGSVSAGLMKGIRYAVVLSSIDDYYSQFIGTGLMPPSFNGGPGSFTAPSTGASFTQTVTPRKSTPVTVSLTGFDVGATVSGNSFSAPAYSASVTSVTPNSVTLRGLPPGPTQVVASGQFVGNPVFGASPIIQVGDNSASPRGAAISGSALADDLSGNIILTTTGDRRIGGKVTAHATLIGAAAQLQDLPGTKVTYSWFGMNILLGGLGLSPLGSGQTLTIPAELAQFNALIVVAHVESPGQRGRTQLGYAWISPLVGASAPTDVIAQGVVTNLGAGFPPVPQVAPRIAGSAVAGKTLTAAPGAWTDSPSAFTYRWLRGASPIAGATGKTYKASAADVGKAISVQVTPVKAGHAIVAFTSAPTGKVAKAAASVSAKLAKKSVKTGKKAIITVKITAAGLKPGGKVTVKFGKKKVTKKLGKKGTVKITSPKLKKGKVKVAISYAGDKATKAAKLAAKKAKKLTITVK